MSCSTTGPLMFKNSSGLCYCDNYCLQSRDCCVDYKETCQAINETSSEKSYHSTGIVSTTSQQSSLGTSPTIQQTETSPETSPIIQQTETSPETSPTIQQTETSPETSPTIQRTETSPETSPIIQQTETSPETSPTIQQTETSPETSPTIQQTETSTETSPTIQRTETSPETSPIIQQTETSPETSPTVQQTETSPETSPTIQQTETSPETSPTIQQTETSPETSPTIQQTETSPETSKIILQTQTSSETSPTIQQTETSTETSPTIQRTETSPETSPIIQQTETSPETSQKQVPQFSKRKHRQKQVPQFNKRKHRQKQFPHFKKQKHRQTQAKSFYKHRHRQKQVPQFNKQKHRQKQVPLFNKRKHRQKQVPQFNEQRHRQKQVPQFNKRKHRQKQVPQFNKRKHRQKQVPQFNKRKHRQKQVPQFNKRKHRQTSPETSKIILQTQTSPETSPTIQQTETSTETSQTIQQTETSPETSPIIQQTETSPETSPTIQQTETSPETSKIILQTQTSPETSPTIQQTETSPETSPTIQQTETSPETSKIIQQTETFSSKTFSEETVTTLSSTTDFLTTDATTELKKSTFHYTSLDTDTWETSTNAFSPSTIFTSQKISEITQITTSETIDLSKSYSTPSKATESSTDKEDSCTCQHGGTCKDSVCVCAIGYQGIYCEDEHIEILSYKSSNSVIREGKSAWFQAEIVGPVGFSVQWSRNGDSISSTASRYVMTSSKTANDTTIHVLNITTVLQRDEGYWTVEALTSLTTEARIITVKVLPRLLLQMAPEYDFSIKTGESINLRCDVINPKSLTGISDGSLVWKKDGIDILLGMEYSGFNISTSNVSSTLEKELADFGDAGRFSCSHSTYPDPVSVSIAISVTKPEQIRCADDEFDNIKWKSTIAGTTKKESCPENQKGTATRYCNFQGLWESPDLINCTDVALVNANEELDSIIADGTTKNVDEAVNNTLVKMKNLTSQRSELSAGDISSSLDILEKIVNVTNMTSANVQKEAFFAVVDNVLSKNNSKSWTAVSDKTEKDASSLLKNMDRMSEVVLKKENITTSKFKGKNFEVSVDKTKVDEKGIVFPEKTEKTPNDTSIDTEEYSTFLELPKQTNKIEKPITYVAVIYKTISDILPTDSGSQTEENSNAVTEGKEKKKKEFVNSEILSLTTQTNLGILSPPLNLAFQHKHENESADLQAICVSWDFITNKWSEEGCKVNSTNNKRTVCQCNHLTNFAILMRPYTPETEDGASLKTLSLVGVVISIAFTVLTFMLFVLTWKQVKSDQNIMLLNLCGSLVVSYIVFIVAVEKTENEGVCIFITALIHYLFLVTFFCMLSMGIYYCMSITVTFYAMYVANNFKSKSRVQWFLLGSWGIPLIIAAITLGAFWGNDYHLKHYCWLSMESGSLFLFIVPVCVIAVMNIMIMVSLIRVLCASSAMTKSSLQKKAASGLRSLGTLLPVLGVTWIFGVLAVNESAEIFQYIFIIANSLQGFCIFISHVLMNKKLMMGIKTKYPSLSGLSMFTESSKKETSSVSRSHSSRSETPLVKPKKKRSLPILGSFLNKKSMKNNKVMKSNSFMTEKTVSTDCPCSETQENSLAMTENAPKEDESSKMIFKEVKTERKVPRVRFNFNLKKKTYVLSEM
ncbi:adhesion G-protein coupled receptor G4-like [Saccostrea cucullata]|uniref:adhesion G-protein coupled receptor G4-like n=1 Tax=Saccostrea cuccullata TaxID=36930 RepID=UPI002ED565B1